MSSDSFGQALHQLAQRHDADAAARTAITRLVEALPRRRTRVPSVSEQYHPEDAIADTILPPSAPGSGSLDTFLSRPAQLKRDGSSNPFRSRSRTRTTRPPTPPVATRQRLGRFINLGAVGRGGMGEVYRVLDPDLNRRMVLKVLREDRVGDEEAIGRFLEEARLTSQLHHPGIVPVHEMGVIDGERFFFTMREVRGRTLGDVIDETHGDFGTNEADEQAWNAHFHPLLDLFHRICEPVAYAHSRGVIHRDLKPSNVMVGDFGEVQILDWGLAKLVDPESATGTAPELPVLDGESDRSKSAFATHHGTIVGTPAYMPPEQARGEIGSLGPAADVYALGAILFTLLDGEPPFSGANVTSVVLQVVEGIERRPGGATGAPSRLVDLCMQAMARDPDDRPTAAELADGIEQWRAGSHRRKQALQLVESADELIPQIEQLRSRAAKLRRHSRRMLQEIPDDAPVEDKRPAWVLEDEAELLEREAGSYRSRAIQSLKGALAHVPQMEEAHRRLAAIYQREHAAAERRRDQTRATSLEVFVRAHNTGEFDEYLQGRGRLQLRTRPPGARVEIHRYLQQNRRLRPGLKRLLGHTPLENKKLAMGSYLLEITASGRDTVFYPVYLGRNDRWTTSGADHDRLDGVYLPFSDELDDDEIYVPPGPFRRGGDERAANSPPRSTRWLDGFVIQKFPVTHGDYLEFLNDLTNTGRCAEAQRHCPRNVGHLGHGSSRSLYRRENGYYRLRSDDPELLGLPVCLLDWYSARAYAKWCARRTGKSWRLPTSDEWEKAARGVDGRFFPWGDFLDPNWCRMVRSTAEAPGPVAVDAYPHDESPYGMRGAAGNIRDWCVPDDVDLECVDDDTLVPFRGGCWFSTPEVCRLAVREFKPPVVRSAGIGLRLARDFP